jgi:hypothetical protein
MRTNIVARLIGVVLIVANLFFMSCSSSKPNTNPGIGQVATSRPALTADDVLRGAKIFGATLATSLAHGIQLERVLAEDGTIDPAIEPKIRQLLQDGKIAVAEFNIRAANYQHFDETSKADIAKLLDDSIAFIARLNNEGILRIKNPRSQLIASGILAGASVAVSVYKSTFDQVK